MSDDTAGVLFLWAAAIAIVQTFLMATLVDSLLSWVVAIALILIKLKLLLRALLHLLAA
jgi:hypothetical protein